MQLDIGKIEYPANSLKENVHGFTFLRCIVEPTGVASKIEILRSMNSESDSVVSNLISELVLNKMWYPAKVNKEVVAQEVIIPIEFSLNGISVYRYNNYWMNGWMMNQMMNQRPVEFHVPGKF